MGKYTLRKQIEIVTESTTLKPENMSGWWAVNQGTSNAVIDNVTIQPGEGIDMYARLHPDIIWSDPIKIVCEDGAKVIITELFYN